MSGTTRVSAIFTDHTRTWTGTLGLSVIKNSEDTKEMRLKSKGLLPQV